MATPRGPRDGGDRGRRSNTANTGRGGRGRHSGSHAQNDGNTSDSGRPTQGTWTRGQGQQRQRARGGGHGNSRNARDESDGQDGNSNPFASSSTSTSDNVTFAPTEYKKRLEQIKAKRVKLRAQFVKEGKMNPDGQMRLKDSVRLYGICEDMCPEYERVRRIVEQDVKAPECTPETEHLPRKDRVPDESRMVKAYARSAAGMDVELVSEIRSPATCLKTVLYLFDRLDHDEFDFLQPWIWDRVRAVRKDLRTQRIETQHGIGILLKVLESSARYYMLSAHLMARSTKEDYSYQQDIEQLTQTMISLRERYIDNRRARVVSESEAEFWAYRLILAPLYANGQLENELAGLPSDLRNNPRVKTAYEIFRVLKCIILTEHTDYHQTQSNWNKFWKIIKSPRVSYMMACAAAISFNKVRHVVLDSIWRSFRIGNSRRPVEIDTWSPAQLKEALGVDTETEAVEHCEAYGFTFEVNAAGKTYLNIREKGYKRGVLARADTKPQFFSATIVEPKRCGRALSAVIQGMTVQEAKTAGLLDESGIHVEDKNSLFVPESSTIFGQQFMGSTSTTGGFGNNAIASPFQPAANQNAAPNPFAKGMSQALSGGTQPGLFDPSKNSIQFAPSTEANTNPFLQKNNASPFQSIPPAAPANPILSNGNAAQAHSTTPTASPNPFLKGPFAAPQPSPQQDVAPSKLEQPAIATPQPAPAFTFPESSFTPSQGASEPDFSFTPAGSPPQADTSSQDVEKQKAEQAEREAAEKQRREDEARQRVLEAQRARQAQEAERRQKAEAEAAQQRQRQQEQADRERRLREEQEQQIRQARQREEEARAARIREKDLALHALTEDIMFDSDQGLLLQFIENATMNISQEVAKEVEMEKRVAYAEKKYERYLVDLKRAALAKIFVAVEKKKKTRRARERRKRLKEQRARLATQEEEELAKAPAPVRPPTETLNEPAHSSVNSTSQRSAPTPSARRAKRTGERRRAQVSEQNGETKADLHPKIPDSKPASKTAKAPLSASMNHGNTSVAAYSQSYQQAAANAPIDRTETDWFRLRAMGIDPSKHRKRSFDFTSSDEEEQPKIEPNKRPKLSPPATESKEPPPAMDVEREQRARFEAIKQGFRRSATSPSQSLNGAESVSGRSSFNGSSNSVIEKARRMVAESRAAMPPPQYHNGAASLKRRESINGHTSSAIAKAREFIGRNNTTSPVQHDWSRSVPNLDFAASLSRPSTFGSSLRTTSANDRPAYWQRVSRFVPRHLYGKGADAARAYREEQNMGNSPASTRPASTEPLALSSPIPTQQSYIPRAQSQQSQSYTQQDRYSEEAESSGVEVVDVEAIEETSEESEADEQQYDDRDEPNPYPGRQYSQQHYDEEQQYDEDDDSEMVDGDDDDEHGYTPGEYHEQASDEDIESYEGDTEEESEDDSPLPQPVQPQQQQWFTQHQQQPMVNGFGAKHPGATEDDAIELSD